MHRAQRGAAKAPCIRDRVCSDGAPSTGKCGKLSLRQAWIACVPLLLAVVGVAVLWEPSHAEHTAALGWLQHYQRPDGVGCCSEQHGVPWSMALLQTTGDEAIVRIGAAVVPLPTTSVHVTQSGQPSWCCWTDANGHCPPVPTRATTRCVFYLGRDVGPSDGSS